MTEKTKKKSFQLPHLLFLLIGLMLLMSILTYILPAGEFVETAEGASEYVQVERTPVSPLKMLLYIYEGTANSGFIIALLLAIGGAVEVALHTKAMDRLIDFCLYKLRDKSASVLLPVTFFIMVLLGAFCATDALIAVIPIGVLFAKKLRLDPITAAGISLLATLVGFSTSPMGVYIAQGLMGVPMYSGFGVRMANMILCSCVGALYVTLYARRIAKDPSGSAMGSLDWQAELGESVELEERSLDPRDLLITAIFILQFPAAIFLNISFGLGTAVMPAVLIPMAVVIGLLHGMKLNEIGRSFEKGVCNMGFICLIIGLAGGISLVMRNGKILDTIAYYACIPLKNLSAGFASIGISMVVSLLNFFVPSATAKAAALVPIIKPMADNLGISGQLAVQAFQIGDGFCNIISPFLGWTIGGLAIAKVPYEKWVKWVLPLVIVFLLMEYGVLVFLSSINWV